MKERSGHPEIPKGNPPIRSMFALGSFRAWMEALYFNRGWERAYWRVGLYISLCRLFSTGLKVADKIGASLLLKNNAPLPIPPVFIIGHWRSGTTFLHNLMSLDPELGYLSTARALAPDLSVFPQDLINSLLQRFIPAKRPMDNLPLSADAPQEDEFALVKMSGTSFYNSWMFPKNARYYFEKYGIMETAGPDEVALWRETYLKLVSRLTRSAGGKRLVLKNPVNTGRIARLLEVFPEAKFIHLVRDPYVVFPSTLNLHRKMLDISRLQTISESEIIDNILYFYTRLQKKYLQERTVIPEGHLVEIRFEDLEKDPMAVLYHIYEQLGLQGFDNAQPTFARHISSQQHYQKNEYTLDSRIMERIHQNWRFAFEAWGYDRKST